jgi:hypothetical protein
MSDQEHKNYLTPKDFWKSDKEFTRFEFPVFRGHIYQEEHSRFETSYWMSEKEKKKKEKEAKKK